jgi:hypothetical protein
VSAEPITLSDAQLARLAAELRPGLARQIADELRGSAAVEPLMKPAEVADMLRMSVEWVHDHADELGVVRLGDGPKAPKRFDATKVREALNRHSGSVRSPAADLPVAAEDSPAAGSERPGNAGEALPVRQLTPPITELSSSATKQIVGPRRANDRAPATRSTASPRRENTRDRVGSTVGRRSSRRSDREESR